jgi:hypothetical protein
MKKQIFISLIFFGLLTFSCEKHDEQAIEDQLYSDIMLIEMQVYSGDFKTITPNEQITNTDFFLGMEKLRKSKSIKERDDAMLYLNNYSGKSENEDIGYEDAAIIESYIRSISDRSYEEILSISELYICDIESLGIPRCSKDKTIGIITFYQDLNIWLNTYTKDYESNTKTEEGREKWDCRSRDCLDCCMYRRLDEISENPVDLFYFVVNAAVNTVVLGLACAWDCI